MNTTKERLAIAQERVKVALVRLGIPEEDVCLVLTAACSGISAPPDSLGLIAKVSYLEGKHVKVQYMNNTTQPATFCVRVNGRNRTERNVTPGKKVTTSYETTACAGFTGQELVVTHKESSMILLKQTL